MIYISSAIFYYETANDKSSSFVWNTLQKKCKDVIS